MTVIKMAAGVTCLGGGELGDVAEVTLFHLPGGGGGVAIKVRNKARDSNCSSLENCN